MCLVSEWYYFWISFFFPLPLYIILFYGWVSLLLVWGFFFNTKKEIHHFSRFYYSFLYQTDKTFVKVNRVHARVRHENLIPSKQRFVLISNHVSNWDQMVVIAALKRKFQPLACVTKPENLSFPIAGPFIHHSGFIPINRDNPLEGKKAIEQGVRYLKDNECNVYICPEGTRNKTEAPTLPFHPGSFRLAMWAKAPIVLLCLKGTKEIKGNAPLKKSYVDIDVVKVITPEEYEGLTPSFLASMCQEIIVDNLLEDSLLL